MKVYPDRGVVGLTGLSGVGKSTTATALAQALSSQGQPACVIDGDTIRRGTFGP